MTDIRRFFVASTAVGLFLAGSLVDAQTVLRDVGYAAAADADPLLTLDVYAPGEGKDLPVMIYIHGGGWRGGDKAAVHSKPRALNERGFVLVSVNYRLSPVAGYREMAGDVARAIAYVRAHAADWNASPERLYLMGHSAGAHLAALVSTDGQYLQAADLSLEALRGVVLLDGGAYDIPSRQIETFPRERTKEIFLSVFGEDLASQRAASPMTHVAADKGLPPFLIIYVADNQTTKIQSMAFGEALRAAGVDAEVVAAEGKTHATLNADFGLPDDKPSESAFAFLGDEEGR